MNHVKKAGCSAGVRSGARTFQSAATLEHSTAPKISATLLFLRCCGLESPRSVLASARRRKSNRCCVNRVFLYLVMGGLALAGQAARADWPEFRGPWGNGHASAPGDNKPIGLPLQWSETNNIKWKTEIPHRGWSTPVVMGGQVWMTAATVD